MREIETKIAHFIDTQFPLFMREEGELFVTFLKTYFEWLEDTGNINEKARKLLSYNDIDDTLDTFITNFKNTYLTGVPNETVTDKRLLIKHALELYRAKGTERGYDILLKALYGRNSIIYYPADDILKTSDGTWNRKQYLEVTNVSGIGSYVGERIIGIGSRAQATVEHYYQQRVKRKIIDVLELSNVKGYFDTGELIRIVGSTETQNLPKIVGSLSDISIINGGAEFSVGDVLDVVSTKGDKGKARVTNTGDRFGLVTFTLTNGGTGYTLDTTPIIYPQIRLTVANVEGTFTANQYIYQANTANIVQQFANGIIVNTAPTQITLKQLNSAYTKANTVYSAIKITIGKQSGNFETGEVVYQSNGTSNVGLGVIVNILSNTSTTATMYVSNVMSGNFFTTSVYSESGNNLVLTGATSSAQGFVYSIDGGNNTGKAVIANVVGGGTGATFKIGNLFRKEIIALNTDYIRDYIDTSLLVFNEASPLTGTVDVTSACNVITGTSTLFTSEYSNNDYIQVDTSVNKQVRQINGIANDTSMTVTEVFNTTRTGKNHFIDIANYGFPKVIGGGNINTIIADALTYEQLEVGSIQYINGINPGTGYSLDPFVEITQPLIAPLNIIETDGSVKGNNAVIQADAGSLSGILRSVAVIDSGFGYDSSEQVTLTSNSSQFSAIGYPQIRSQGRSAGEWTTTRGFLNSDKFIQDSYYYQEYSYEVRTQLDFNLYKDVVKTLLHPAGVALFGRFSLKTEMTNAQSTYVTSSITQANT